MGSGPDDRTFIESDKGKLFVVDRHNKEGREFIIFFEDGTIYDSFLLRYSKATPWRLENKNVKHRKEKEMEKIKTWFNDESQS